MKWTPALIAGLRANHAAGLKQRAIAARMHLTLGQVQGKSRVLNLHFHTETGGEALAKTHPAVVEGRTLFPSRVQVASDAPSILKPGADSYKLGSVVSKGAWRGMPIYSLTLEERKTCPASCPQWTGCYGNTSPFRIRLEAGPELEARLGRELHHLNAKHRRGFVVRLHVLGDFYSPEYVALWRGWLRLFPALHVFGYSAWPPGSRIGGAVHRLATEQWERFAVRWSALEPGEARAIVVRPMDGSPDGAILCPAQTGATRSCATCGLCWAPAARGKTIAFLQHGMKRRGKES